MTSASDTSASAQPSIARVVAILGTVALVAGLWTVYGPNVGAGVTVGVFLVWGVVRWFKTQREAVK